MKVRKWSVWWQGSTTGPSGQRGDHIMEMNEHGMGYGREIAFLGDQHHEAAGALVHEHNQVVEEILTTPASPEFTDDQIDAVAEAINTARYDTQIWRDNNPGGPPKLADEDQSAQEYARRLARAALSATPVYGADNG